MHWFLFPLLLTAVTAASVEPAGTAAAKGPAEDAERDGKCKNKQVLSH